MPKLRRLSGKQVLDLLLKAGFYVHRTKGSHHQLRYDDDDSCQVTVSVHGNQTMPIGTLKSIVDQVSGCLSDKKILEIFYQ